MGTMRVAIVTESFLPNRDQVTDSVLHIVDHLRCADHETLLIAPDTPHGEPPAARIHDGVRVHRVPVLRLPGGAPVGLPWPRMMGVLRGFAPDVVHLASPTLLGYGGLRAACRLGVPTVAVHQADAAGPLTRHLYRRVNRTLAVSGPGLEILAAHGIPRMHYWPLDSGRPPAHPDLADHYRAVRAMPSNLRAREPVASVR